MKNTTRLITAGFGLMMILSLFIGGVEALADPASAPGAPAAGPITDFSVDSPANNSYLASGDVLVQWTVVGGEDNWNLTRMWTANEGWGDWINVSDSDFHLFEDLVDGVHYVQVEAYSEYDNPTTFTENVTFTVDTVDPVVTVELPFDDSTNETDFLLSWVYEDVTPLHNTSVVLTGPVNGSIEIAGSATSVLISAINSDPLVEGDYAVNVTVYDSALNHAFALMEFSVGPAVEFVTPDDDDPVFGFDDVWYTNDGNFTIEWTVSLFNGTSIVEQEINITNITTGWYTGEISIDPSLRSISVFDVTGFNLTDGLYSVSVEVEDNKTFIGEDTEIFAVDNEEPDPEFVTPVNDAVPKWYTNDNNFTAEWMYEPDPWGTPIGSQIVTIDNGTTSMSLAVDPAELSVSIYDVWGDVLADGNYSIYMNATDILGNWHNETEAFTVDTVGPEFEMIVPDEEVDPNYFNDNNFTIEWSAFEADLLETPVVSLVISISNETETRTLSVDIGNTTASVSDVWGDVLPDGAYVVSVNATDAAGNYEDEVANVTIDAADPTLDVTYPPEITNDNEVNATWTVDGTGSPVDSVMLSIRNVTGNYTFAAIDVTGVNNITLSDQIGSLLADGNWMLSFNVTDMAGNYAVIEYAFLVDTVPPTVVITDPSEGGFVNTTAVLIEWSASDVGVVPSGIEYLFIRNDTGTWITLDAAALSHTLDLDEGSHFVEVRAIDFAGNSFIASVTFTVDVTLPSVEITYPADGAMFSYNELTIEWTGSDALSGIAYFEVMVDDLDWVNVGYDLSYDVSGLLDGVHVITVRAVDNASNMNTSSVSITVDITDPTVTIDAPADGLHTNEVDVNMTWTADDATTDIAYIHVWNDTGAVVNLTADNVYYVFVNLTEGAHTLHVMVFDTVGNSQEESVSVVIDLTDPEVNIVYPDDGQRINDVVINATWIVMDNLSPIVLIEVAIDDGLYVEVGLNTSQLFADVAEGNHSIFVRATDSAGNVGTNHVVFVVDRTAPTMTAHTPTAAIVAPDVAVTVTFSEPMNQDTVEFAGITGTMAWNTAGTVVTLTHAALAYATTFNVVVTGEDLAGNAVSGASWSFTVETQVTGTVNDDKGEPIANATVTISQGGVTLAEGVTDANGHFALIVDGVGTYNMTISATGFQDKVLTDQAFGVEQNNVLEPQAMTPNPDYTLLIVGVVAVVAIVGAGLYLMRRKK